VSWQYDLHHDVETWVGTGTLARPESL